MPQAQKLFHAEAAATERRTIDVAGGTFHRPHLLDRRHAAFVLLANLPLWTLPWITLRIFASAIIRAVGYLLVKLPGYALDEVGAIALLFTRLDRLRAARRARRKKRLLPARVIRPLLAPWSEQIKLGALRVRDLLLRRVERVPEPVVGNIFAESDDAYEGVTRPHKQWLLATTPKPSISDSHRATPASLDYCRQVALWRSCRRRAHKSR